MHQNNNVIFKKKTKNLVYSHHITTENELDHNTACLGDGTLYNYQFEPLHRLGTQLTIRQ